MQTQKQNLNNDQIINALGGTSRVAEIFGVTTGAISQWRTKGIPDARLFSIKLLRPDLFKSEG